MKIRTTIDLIANAYHVIFEIVSVSALETELIRQFGEPEVETGGTISGSATVPGDQSPTAVTFTVPVRIRQVPTEFPFKQVFSLDDNVQAGLMAAVYRTTIEARLSAARTALISQSPDFVGETVTTL
jgi:hypothetical protein